MTVTFVFKDSLFDYRLLLKSIVRQYKSESRKCLDTHVTNKPFCVFSYIHDLFHTLKMHITSTRAQFLGGYLYLSFTKSIGACFCLLL